MNRLQVAGVVWLVAAVIGALATVIFRGDEPAWYAITLVASAIAAAIGILLLWRPSRTTVVLSTLGGVAWVVLYGALIAIQSADIQAWTADLLFAVIGAVAAILAYRASREAAAPLGN